MCDNNVDVEHTCGIGMVWLLKLVYYNCGVEGVVAVLLSVLWLMLPRPVGVCGVERAMVM